VHDPSPAAEASAKEVWIVRYGRSSGSTFLPIGKIAFLILQYCGSGFVIPGMILVGPEDRLPLDAILLWLPKCSEGGRIDRLQITP